MKASSNHPAKVAALDMSPAMVSYGRGLAAKAGVDVDYVKVGHNTSKYPAGTSPLTKHLHRPAVELALVG